MKKKVNYIFSSPISHSFAFFFFLIKKIEKTQKAMNIFLLIQKKKERKNRTYTCSHKSITHQQQPMSKKANPRRKRIQLFTNYNPWQRLQISTVWDTPTSNQNAPSTLYATSSPIEDRAIHQLTKSYINYQIPQLTPILSPIPKSKHNSNKKEKNKAK